MLVMPCPPTRKKEASSVNALATLRAMESPGAGAQDDIPKK